MRIHRYTVAPLILISLLLAACGRDDEPENDAPPTSQITPVSVSVGSAAPGFTLPTSDGGSVSLADYQGKQPVLLFFHMAAG